MLKNMEHLLRSTDHLLSIIPTLHFSSPDRIEIITLDVKSLYTSIPLDKGLSDSLKWLFKASPQKRPPIIREFIFRSLEIILYNNLFEFGEKAFKQVKGVAMGSPVSLNPILDPIKRAIFNTNFALINQFPRSQSLCGCNRRTKARSTITAVRG